MTQEQEQQLVRYPCKGLEGIQFGDLQKRGESKNREFYLDLLRTFIADHPKKIVWVKGGIKEREAYIVFDAEIHNELRDFWLQIFNPDGQFAIRALTYDEIAAIMEKLRDDERVYLGSLHPDYELMPYDAVTDDEWEHPIDPAQYRSDSDSTTYYVRCLLNCEHLVA